MLLQGVGQGVFQVAYFDLITATMPLHSRGVAGSLGMLTRTMGVVSGASLLMLGFQAIGGGAPTDVAFAAGFRGVMHGAAALAAVVAPGLALRGRMGSSGRCK
ncbi:MAG TPA: hypothetical protein VFW75_17815, partial [Acetobacteraceae bacterium]|nr:hypothetical protein [Acetobacteraceae bacterium]